jgi:hypothetical protein
MGRTIRDTTITANWPNIGDHWWLRKPVLYTVGTATMVLFGDVLVPAAAHLLLLGLEVIEALFDHAIESIFQVDPWTSQLITAWTGFFAFLALSAWLFRWLRRKFLAYKTMLASWYHDHFFHA